MSKKISKNKGTRDTRDTRDIIDAKDARPDFDASMAEIESLIEQIESGSIGLEEQLSAYERGAKLLKGCRELLDVAEQRVVEIDANLNRLEESTEGTDEDPAGSS